MISAYLNVNFHEIFMLCNNEIFKIYNSVKFGSIKSIANEEKHLDCNLVVSNLTDLGVYTAMSEKKLLCVNFCRITVFCQRKRFAFAEKFC